MEAHVVAGGVIVSRAPVPMHLKLVQSSRGKSGGGSGMLTTIGGLASGKSSDGCPLTLPPLQKRGVTTREARQEVARSALVNGIELKRAALI
jgi:hypothetical protein